MVIMVFTGQQVQQAHDISCSIFQTDFLFGKKLHNGTRFDFFHTTFFTPDMVVWLKTAQRFVV